MSKSYKVTVETVSRFTDDRFWYIEYKNIFWGKNIVSKCFGTEVLEHKNKFIELLEEAGYKEDKEVLEKDPIVDKEGYFTFLWENTYFVETENGNFVWQRPSNYNIANTLKKLPMSLEDYIERMKLTGDRNRVQYRIGTFCGENIKIVP